MFSMTVSLLNDRSRILSKNGASVQGTITDEHRSSHGHSCHRAPSSLSVGILSKHDCWRLYQPFHVGQRGSFLKLF